MPAVSDIYAFIDWLQEGDKDFSARVQWAHDRWLDLVAKLYNPTRPRTPEICCIDNRYSIRRVGNDFALHSLMDPPHGLMALYRTPGPMFADLIAHSIRRSGHRSSAAFTAEAVRLATLCEAAWTSAGMN